MFISFLYAFKGLAVIYTMAKCSFLFCHDRYIIIQEIFMLIRLVLFSK